MKLKKIAALGLASVMTLSLAACGGDSGNGGGGSSEPAEVSLDPSSFTAKELTVNIWDNNQLAGLQQIADKWTETSGVKVNINVVDWNNYWTLLESGAQGGTMPDVFWMHSNTAQMYMDANMLLNLDPYIEADSAIDTSKYYEGIVNLYTRSSDGVHFAIPKDHDTIALLYNKALFDKYGVAYPTDEWTWEDMYNAAKTITEKGKADNVYGLAMNTSNNQDGWYNLVYDYGGQIITEDHKGTTIGSTEGKAGMEMVRKLLTVGTPQTMVSESGTDSLFQSGQVAMITQGSWMVNAFYTAEHHADYAWAMLPYADVNGNGACDEGERYSCYNGLGWAASASTADPNAAWSLISYFCSEEGQKMQSELGVTMAGMLGMSDAFTTAFEGMDLSAFTRIEEEGTLYFRPYTRKTTVWEDAIQKEGIFLDAWQNPDDAALMSSACDAAQKRIEEAIAAE